MKIGWIFLLRASIIRFLLYYVHSEVLIFRSKDFGIVGLRLYKMELIGRSLKMFITGFDKENLRYGIIFGHNFFRILFSPSDRYFRDRLTKALQRKKVPHVAVPKSILPANRF